MPTLSYTGKRDGLADQPKGAAAAGDVTAEFTTGMAQQPSDSELSHISDDVPLFAFDASNTDTLSGGRPKRKLKAIARFESMTFDKKAAHTKIGEGFSCPGCTGEFASPGSVSSLPLANAHITCPFQLHALTTLRNAPTVNFRAITKQGLEWWCSKKGKLTSRDST